MISRCVSCGGESLENKVSAFEKWVNGIKVSVSDVRFLECRECGERYIWDEDYQKVEAEAEKFLNKAYALENRIEKIRKEKGFTLEDVALRLGTSRQRINDIEKGKHTPSVLLGLVLAQALECDLKDIYGLKIVDAVKKVVKKNR